tara:strand:+ start:4964 stop:5434 length:471 start_codon:yes stop_codon:yes gene_type:complete
MSNKKSKNVYSGTELEMEYVKGTDKNLFLDKPYMALTNLSTKKNGKEVPVGKQISNYLKNMGLLEKSLEELEDIIEESSVKIRKINKLLESHIVKKRYKGKVYSTTAKMINAVKLFEAGKIKKIDLIESASWAEDPEAAIRVAMMIAGIGSFKNKC